MSAFSLVVMLPMFHLTSEDPVGIGAVCHDERQKKNSPSKQKLQAFIRRGGLAVGKAKGNEIGKSAHSEPCCCQHEQSNTTEVGFEGFVIL